MKMIDVDVLKERALKDPEIKAEYDRLGRPKGWDGMIDAIKAGGVPADFLSPRERDQDAAPPPGRTGGSTGKAPPG